MSDDRERDDAAFAERVARVLRAPELFDDDFETTLTDAIRAGGPAERVSAPIARPLAASWWRTPLTMRVTPLATMAMAASLVLVASLATLRLASPRSVQPVAVAAQAVHDTVHVVRFVFVGRATSVSLVGDFNAWGADATPLAATGENGTWAVSVPLPAGRHEYAFIVDGKRWVADPFAPVAFDEFGTNSSIINVGS